jgi:hypothetical protein
MPAQNDAQPLQIAQTPPAPPVEISENVLKKVLEG